MAAAHGCQQQWRRGKYHQNGSRKLAAAAKRNGGWHRNASCAASIGIAISEK